MKIQKKRRKKLKQFSDIEKGWLAAAIDGEGTIRSGLGRTFIQVVNTNEAFIKYAASLLGPLAHIYVYDDVEGTRLRKYTIKLQVQADIKEILIQIEPYLIIKRELAQKTIEWCNGRFKRKARAYDKNGNAKLTIEKVLRIRLAYDTGKFSMSAMARTVGVSVALISKICKHRMWKHITQQLTITSIETLDELLQDPSSAELPEEVLSREDDDSSTSDDNSESDSVLRGVD